MTRQLKVCDSSKRRFVTPVRSKEHFVTRPGQLLFLSVFFPTLLKLRKKVFPGFHTSGGALVPVPSSFEVARTHPSGRPPPEKAK